MAGGRRVPHGGAQWWWCAKIIWVAHMKDQKSVFFFWSECVTRPKECLITVKYAPQLGQCAVRSD
jgi:hypothetical protein